MTQVPVADRKKIAKEYAAGTPIHLLAKKFGVALATVQRWIADAGVEIRSGSGRKPNPRNKDIIKAYVRGDPLRMIADKFDCTWQNVHHIARTAGLPIRHKRAKVPPEQRTSELTALFSSGLSVQQVANKTGLERASVYMWKRRHIP